MVKLCKNVNINDLTIYGFRDYGSTLEYYEETFEDKDNLLWRIVIRINKNTKIVDWNIYKSLKNIEDNYLYEIINSKLTELAKRKIIYKEANK